ncbi:hypothetical protein LTR85_000068 [Meristemomyces frigidus]|nr:hypothetical protein LTR85_000068 [Meristemomyces frigidus]
MDLMSELPPHGDVVEGCQVFLTTGLQLGFLPKALYLEAVSRDMHAVHPFLLFSVLAISARFTACLAKRFGGSSNASDYFIELASHCVAEQMYETSLENMQAFFLLGMAEWARGNRSRSSIDMGIAVRMAGNLRLHREESYALSADSTAEQIVQSEVARRTFWVCLNHDNLATGHDQPVSFARNDITTLLPCEEDEFAFGRVPHGRAALPGTKAAEDNPALTVLPSRSLFASLIQGHDLWGQIARRACQDGRHLLGDEFKRWDSRSKYSRLASELREWEEHLPAPHRWSAWNFRGYRTAGVHLAFLSLVMISRLNNIILRRVHLSSMHAASTSSASPIDGSPTGFWHRMAYELFTDVHSLYTSLDLFFTLQRSSEGLPSMLAFSVYTCGALAASLIRTPSLCAKRAPEAEIILTASVSNLERVADKWPAALQFVGALHKAAADTPGPSHEGSTAHAATPHIGAAQQHAPHERSISRPYSTADPAPNALYNTFASSPTFADANRALGPNLQDAQLGGQTLSRYAQHALSQSGPGHGVHGMSQPHGQHGGDAWPDFDFSNTFEHDLDEFVQGYVSLDFRAE